MEHSPELQPKQTEGVGKDSVILETDLFPGFIAKGRYNTGRSCVINAKPEVVKCRP